jgi:hypothetical protein
MTSLLNTQSLTAGKIFLVLVAVGVGALLHAQQAQPGQEPDGRHVCPVEAIRNGTCVPNPTEKQGSSVSVPKRTQMYKRVAKQTDTTAGCNVRVKSLRPSMMKNTTACDGDRVNQKEDLPLSSQSVGITIWKVQEVQRGYTGARILWHQDKSQSPIEYQAERLAGDPILAYGDKVRLGIESRLDGYLYVFDRELYSDGSLSPAYMIFPTTRLLEGNNRIVANKPVEVPSLTDVPFFFEAKKIGLDPNKTLVGEILSVVITDKPLSDFNKVDRSVLQVPAREMESIERLYSGIAEVFELEHGLGQPYSEVERDAATKGARLLTHADPVPQTFYLIRSKHAGGLLVSLALTYKDIEKSPQ